MIQFGVKLVQLCEWSDVDVVQCQQVKLVATKQDQKMLLLP